MRTATLIVATLAILACAAGSRTLFREKFSDGVAWRERWIDGRARGGAPLGEWEALDEGGIRTATNASFYAIYAPFETPAAANATLRVRIAVKNSESLACGGLYVKLLPRLEKPSTFDGESAYRIMFGPDMCGPGTQRTHLIFNHGKKNLERKTAIRAPLDGKKHTYALILRPVNQSYAVYVDGEEVAGGFLVDDWEFTREPRMIDDPDAKKPDGWVDEPTLPDPEDKKPEDWVDGPETIPDPDATKPEDWDEEEDGAWTAPTISNPEYKGPWTPKQIPNPGYKGAWVPPRIPNPKFVPSATAGRYSDIAAVGIDVWQVEAGSEYAEIVVEDDGDDVPIKSTPSADPTPDREL